MVSGVPKSQVPFPYAFPLGQLYIMSGIYAWEPKDLSSSPYCYDCSLLEFSQVNFTSVSLSDILYKMGIDLEQVREL